MDVDRLLERIGKGVAIALVAVGALVPGRELAVGAGMGLLAGIVGVTGIRKKKDEEEDQ